MPFCIFSYRCHNDKIHTFPKMDTFFSSSSSSMGTCTVYVIRLVHLLHVTGHPIHFGVLRVCSDVTFLEFYCVSELSRSTVQHSSIWSHGIRSITQKSLRNTFKGPRLAHFRLRDKHDLKVSKQYELSNWQNFPPNGDVCARTRANVQAIMFIKVNVNADEQTRSSGSSHSPLRTKTQLARSRIHLVAKLMRSGFT